jgi:hypothetical protein
MDLVLVSTGDITLAPSASTSAGGAGIDHIRDTDVEPYAASCSVQGLLPGPAPFTCDCWRGQSRRAGFAISC